MLLLLQGFASLIDRPSQVVIVPDNVIFFVASIVLLLDQLFKHLQFLVIFPFASLASIRFVTGFLRPQLFLLVPLEIVILGADSNSVARLVVAFVHLLGSLESLHHFLLIFIIN